LVMFFEAIIEREFNYIYFRAMQTRESNSEKRFIYTFTSPGIHVRIVIEKIAINLSENLITIAKLMGRELI
jgi:hypothetical protein